MLLQCRAGALLTRQFTQGWTPQVPETLTTDTTCPSCTAGCPETIAHLLIECPAYISLPGGNDRTHLMALLTSLLDPTQLAQWRPLPQSTKLKNLLSCTCWPGGTTLPLHSAIKEFLVAAWTKRQVSIDHPGERTTPCPTAVVSPSGNHQSLPANPGGPLPMGPSNNPQLVPCEPDLDASSASSQHNITSCCCGSLYMP